MSRARYELAGTRVPRRKEMASLAREAFGEGIPAAAAELSPLQADLWKAIQKKRAELAEKDAGPDERREAIQEISEAYYVQQSLVREQIEQKISEAEAKYKRTRNSVDELLNLERAKLRYATMDKFDLSQEISSYITDPQGRDPDDLRALEAAAVAKGNANVENLRKAMAENDFERPWASPELKALKRMYSAKFGETVVASPAWGEMSVPLSDLFDDSPVTTGVEST